MVAPVFTNRPDALLLDVGDTLLFFDARAVCGALEEQGIRVQPATLDLALHRAKRKYHDHVGERAPHADPWAGLVYDMLVNAGVEGDRARAALPGLRKIHDDYYFWRRVPESVPGALARISAAGVRLAVVSNSEGKVAEMIERAGLAHFFTMVLDSHIEGVQKPNPEIFLRCLARLGVAPERALYAGDIPEVDVLGPQRAGMQGVLIDPPGHYRDDPRWPRVESLGELADLLLALPVATA